MQKIGFLESDSKQRPYNAQLQLVPLNPQHIKEKYGIKNNRYVLWL
jgi:hypothetical protein